MELKFNDYFDAYPVVIGHRGNPGRATENTEKALIFGIESGADMVEIDLRVSKDGEPVIFHDGDTSRLSATKVVIENTTLAQLKKIPLAGGEKIMTLYEALEAARGRIPLNIEIKAPGAARVLAEKISTHEAPFPPLVSSFYPDELKMFREACPKLLTSALIRRPSREMIRDASASGHVSVNVNRRFFSEWMVEEAAKEGLALLIYTVDHRDNFEELVSAGASGFFTNVPDLMVGWKREIRGK